MASTDGEAPVALAPQVRTAARIVCAQAIGLTVVAVVLVWKIVTGDPGKLSGALLEVLFCLFGIALFAFIARGLFQARAGALLIVLEILALPVSYSLTFQADLPLYGGPILISALAVLYLVFTPQARGIFQRPDDWGGTPKAS